MARVLTALGLLAMAAVAAPPATAAGLGWIAPGADVTLPAYSEFDNPLGRHGVLSVSGAVRTKGHPFFAATGPDGRACVSCHQPADAMSLSVATVQARWKATAGRDPLFAPFDGADCPNRPRGTQASHSLLLKHGLFRIPLAWPPKGVTPQFDIEVVSDPTGCNTDPKYGLTSATPTVSVFRRPRMSANLSFITRSIYKDRFFSSKNGLPLAKDPDSGQHIPITIMSDARAINLRHQAVDATMGHLQAQAADPVVMARIVGFESGLYAAQAVDARAGSLTAPGGPTQLGPAFMAKTQVGDLADNLQFPIFGHFDGWKGSVAARKASIARGYDVFFLKPIWIRDATHINTIGLGNPVRRTCSTCHNMHLMGIDVGPGWMDVGTANEPWADPAPHLPLFRITCKAAARPHPYLGRTILTHDPGRALISGRCDDVGALAMHQFRGLAARAPYFANGGAKDIAAIVDFYDRRFQVGYTAQEKADLTAFLSTL